jgi:tripartite-type tricarboxylate transporter receptor subunit TctC
MQSVRSICHGAAALALVGGVGLVSQPLAAQPAADFYKGKALVLLIGGTAGGGLDTAARIFARHFGKHVPGNPTITPQLMPGAGGIRVLDYLASAAPKDGTTIATTPSGPLIEPLIGNRKLKYTMTDFVMLGAWVNDVSLCFAWHTAGFKTLDDVKQRVMTVAGTGAGATTDIYPKVLNGVLGTKFKVITGYQGTRETALAIERGETHGRCGWTWSSLRGVKPNWLKEKKLVMLLQMGIEKSPDFPDVPFALDLAKTEEDKKLLSLLFAPLALSNPYFAPPGLAADKVEVLRKAWSDTLADKEVIAETIKQTQGPPEPTSGAKMQKVMADMYATPDKVVQRLKELLK